MKTFTLAELERMLADATPGPWELERIKPGDEFVALNTSPFSKRIWGAFAQFVIKMDGESRQSVEGVANANLAASAPDLATALHAALVREKERDAEVAKLRAELEGWVSIAENCEISTGYCCCGDDMRNHQNPMDCGHTPVDQGGYSASQQMQSTRAALKVTP